MDIMIIILIFADVFLFGMILFTYSAVTQAYDFSKELADLLSRTLKQYYQTENIEPQLINNGIDLVWNPNNEDTSAKRGFITVLTQDAIDYFNYYTSEYPILIVTLKVESDSFFHYNKD